jgi:hypothetical protein
VYVCHTQATDAANAAYLSEKSELCKAAGVSEADVLLFEPETNTTRPAYAVWVDKKNKRIVWGFRGTTDLNVSDSSSTDSSSSSSRAGSSSSNTKALLQQCWARQRLVPQRQPHVHAWFSC